MKHPILLALFALLLASCTKEAPIAVVVELEAACEHCRIVATHNGDAAEKVLGDGSKGSALAPLSRFDTAFVALVGDEVGIHATTFKRSDFTVLVSVKVDGRLRGLRYLLPKETGTGATVGYTLAVPDPGESVWR